MTVSSSTWMSAGLWIWVVGVMAAYLFQFRNIAGRVIDILFAGA